MKFHAASKRKIIWISLRISNCYKADSHANPGGCHLLISRRNTVSWAYCQTGSYVLFNDQECWMLHKHINFKRWGTTPDLKNWHYMLPKKKKKSTKQFSGISRTRRRWKGINNTAKLCLNIVRWCLLVLEILMFLLNMWMNENRHVSQPLGCGYPEKTSNRTLHSCISQCICSLSMCRHGVQYIFKVFKINNH